MSEREADKAGQRTFEQSANDAATTPGMPAQNQPPFAHSRTGLALRAIPSRKAHLRLAALACVAALAVIILGLFRSTLFVQPPAHGSQRPNIASRLVIVPASQNLRSPMDIAWTLQGDRIAVLGKLATSTSSGSSPTDSQVNIYDALSGKLMSQFKPGIPVITALNATPSFSSVLVPGSTVNLLFRHVLWSPDGRRLALTFSGNVQSDTPPSEVSFTGVLLCNAAGGQARVLQRMVNSRVSAFAIWDLDSGLVASSVVPSSALSFRWDNEGALHSGSPLNASSLPPSVPQSPVGWPDGTSPFAIWQPAEVSLQVHDPYDPNRVVHPGIYVWTGEFAAWSPDGRYLLDLKFVTARFQPSNRPTPTKQVITSFGFAQAPLLPIRDAGLQALLDSLPVDATTDSYAEVSWRPDGRFLAAQQIIGDAGGAPSQSAVAILDCATGQQVAKLFPSGQSALPDPASSILRWSLDGSRLLAYDHDLRTITIWGPGSLPQPSSVSP